MDMSPTKTTVSKNTSLIWKIAAVFFLCTTVIFVSLFIWSELKGRLYTCVYVLHLEHFCKF